MIKIYLQSVLLWTTIIYALCLIFHGHLEAILKRNRTHKNDIDEMIGTSNNCWKMLIASALMSIVPIYRILIAISIIRFRDDEND